MSAAGARRQFDPEDVLTRLDRRKVRNAGYKRVRIHVALTEQELGVLDVRPARGLRRPRDESRLVRCRLRGRVPMVRIRSAANQLSDYSSRVRIS